MPPPRPRTPPEPKWIREQPFWDETFRVALHGKLAGGTQRDGDADYLDPDSLTQFATDTADAAIEKRDASRERRKHEQNG